MRNTVKANFRCGEKFNLAYFPGYLFIFLGLERIISRITTLQNEAEVHV